MKKKKKRVILLLIAMALLLLGVGFFLKEKGKWQSLSTQFQESGRKDIIVYNGKKYRYNDDLSNYLFLGIDTKNPVEQYEVRGEAGQADAIYLLSYNRQDKSVQYLAIPRDTMADIRVIGPDGTELGTNKDQITLQYAFGAGKRDSCELMKEAVSNLLYGIPIQGYCALNIDGIPIATDKIGGVDLIVPDNTLVEMNPDFFEGNKVTITKETAEQFVRYRDTEKTQSAIARLDRQKVFVEAYAQKAKTLFKKDPEILADIYESVEDYMVTNMNVELFAEIAKVADISGEKIQNIPGKGIDGGEFDEYYVNEGQLQELILQMFYEEM